MAKYRIRSDRYPQYPADAHDVLRFLGFRSAPTAGHPPTQIQGITVYVRPLVPNPAKRRNFTGLRVRAICPGCARDLAAGRLAQHECKLPPLDQVTPRVAVFNPDWRTDGQGHK
jgi:hypothetical protein